MSPATLALPYEPGTYVTVVVGRGGVQNVSGFFVKADAAGVTVKSAGYTQWIPMAKVTQMLAQDCTD